MSAHKEIDSATGVETTGHVWDGDLKELNKPLPRWWLYTFYVCILWAFGYWVVYPTWPTLDGYTRGVLNYSARQSVADQIEAAKGAQQGFQDQLAKTPIGEVRDNPELLRFAVAKGAAAFGTNCAPCHGRGAQGAAGYPNLNDDDWLWGGTIDDIHKTVLFGIRSDHADTRVSDMPRFGLDQALDRNQINDAAEYVLSLSGKGEDKEAALRGAQIFADNCAACHGETGTGNQELGAPNLSDAIWLYGSRKEDVVRTIETGRGGKMPAWNGRLDDLTIKALAVYVQSLGGARD
jgi:cytochrome c oxidase cbb3-type subunit 3